MNQSAGLEPGRSNVGAIAISASTYEGWLSSGDFSLLAGVSRRMATKLFSSAADGKRWKGHQLMVREVPGIGGCSGKNIKLNPHSLPKDLREKWFTGHPPEDPAASHVEVITSPIKANPKREKDTRRQHWKYEIIEAALQYPYGSPERKDEVRIASERCGKNRSTLYRWINSYEQNGISGLARAGRRDKGERRTLISQEFDQACPLPEAGKIKVADELQRYNRSLMAGGVPSLSIAQRFCESNLLELAQAAGWDQASLQSCKVTRAFVERDIQYRQVSTKQNAKEFYDKQRPYIKRTKTGSEPGDVVFGDVHHLDIGVCREDGSIAYPKAICWQDFATNQMHVTLVFPEKGKGVTRLHVARSFAAMCNVMGLPKCLYLDNGSEYKWDEMIEGFKELSGLADQLEIRYAKDYPELERRRAAAGKVVRSIAYRPTGKSIEGTFGVLEGGAFKMLSGWVGGNRMRKKSANLGKSPEPFKGTWEEFHAQLTEAIHWYHTQPQTGQLQGKSPAQTLQAFIDAGWTKTAIDEKALLVSFATEDTRTPDRGYVQWQGSQYYHDDLMPYTGRKLTVRVAPQDSRFLFAFDKSANLICAATRAETYHILDPAGAKEQARREGKLNQTIKGLRKNVDRLDLAEEMSRDLKHRGEMPEAPVGKTVQLSKQSRQMLDVFERSNEESINEIQARAPGKSLSQWSRDDDSDPYLDAVNFDE